MHTMFMIDSRDTFCEKIGKNSLKIVRSIFAVFSFWNYERNWNTKSDQHSVNKRPNFWICALSFPCIGPDGNLEFQ